jgi:homoserine kinase
MVQLVSGPVRASVPATSANLGPGFDALGLALALRDELTAEVLDSGLRVDVSGQGAESVARDETHLVVRSMRAAFEHMGVTVPGLRVACRNAIPHGRGLGSSSAAIVAGVSLARGLVAGGSLLLDDDSLFQLAVELEGHPDNVAPAFFGGFVISGREGDQWFAVRSGVDPRVQTVVFVPPTAVATTVARELLPTSVPFADAAANSGRTALLVAALAGRPERLLAATRDYLHQQYREPAMPESLALVRELRADDVPAVISGAGPTVLAFCDGPGLPGRCEALLARCPAGWTAHQLAIDLDGVRVS